MSRSEIARSCWSIPNGTFRQYATKFLCALPECNTKAVWCFVIAFAPIAAQTMKNVDILRFIIGSGFCGLSGDCIYL